MRVKRFVSLMTAGVLALSMVPASVQAEENVHTAGYEATDAYGLRYETNITGKYGPYAFEYVSPYSPEMTYKHFNQTYTDYTGMGNMYNVNNPGEYIKVYCVDQYTGIADAFYKRMNLEDSDFYSVDAAALLRSIVSGGFPNVDCETLAELAGVDSLTVGEAVSATQLAIWQASYGDQLIVENFVGKIQKWFDSGYYRNKIRNKEECYKEINNNYASDENIDTISNHIEAVYNYLMNLEPTAPNEVAVSAASFVEWSDTPVVVEDGEGIYDITVSATVNVVEHDGDDLKLSAVLGNYFTTVDLENGSQTIEITIQDVPADAAQGKITLAIDGTQTVTDVYMFEVEGGREAAQRRIGYSNLQLPVHAEVTVEPERIIEFWKTTKVSVRDDAEGNPVYERLPLEGIVFDLFFVTDLDKYVSGQEILPAVPEIKAPTDKEYNYPDYTVTTDEEGKATVNLTKSGLADGVYIVREREHAAIKEPVEPFYIMLPYTNENEDGWKYKLKIEPKNTVIPGPEIKKDVIEIEHVDKSGEEEQRFFVDAGEAFTWIIRGGIPVDLKDAKEYVITDTLDYRLTYAENLVVKVEEITAEADNSVSNGDVLEADEDYKLTINSKKDTVNGKEEDIKELVIELTAAGMDKVAEIAGEEYAGKEIRVYFNTVIDGDVMDSMGKNIANQATLEYTNSANFQYESESDDPRVYTCGINLYKYDAKKGAEDPEGALAGAIFRLAKVVDKETEGAAPLVTKETGTVHVVYEEFYTAINADGELAAKNDTVITDAEGKAMLYGLEEGTYYLVETKAPDGYNLLSYPVEVTLNNVSHVTEDDPATEANEDMTVKVANSNQFRLPETGGIGTTIFTASGIMMLAAAAVVLVMKKKEEEV